MEPVLVLIVIFGSILMLSKMNLDYKRSKLTSGSGDGSFRQSEIKQLIREAVDEAIQPVLEKMDQHEKQLSSSEQRLLETPVESLESELD